MAKTQNGRFFLTDCVNGSPALRFAKKAEWNGSRWIYKITDVVYILRPLLLLIGILPKDPMKFQQSAIEIKFAFKGNLYSAVFFKKPPITNKEGEQVHPACYKILLFGSANDGRKNRIHFLRIYISNDGRNWEREWVVAKGGENSCPEDRMSPRQVGYTLCAELLHGRDAKKKKIWGEGKDEDGNKNPPPIDSTDMWAFLLLSDGKTARAMQWDVDGKLKTRYLPFFFEIPTSGPSEDCANATDIEVKIANPDKEGEFLQEDDAKIRRDNLKSRKGRVAYCLEGNITENVCAEDKKTVGRAWAVSDPDSEWDFVVTTANPEKKKKRKRRNRKRFTSNDNDEASAPESVEATVEDLDGEADFVTSDEDAAPTELETIAKEVDDKGPTVPSGSMPKRQWSATNFGALLENIQAEEEAETEEDSPQSVALTVVM